MPTVRFLSSVTLARIHCAVDTCTPLTTKVSNAPVNPFSSTRLRRSDATPIRTAKSCALAVREDDTAPESIIARFQMVVARTPVHSKGCKDE